MPKYRRFRGILDGPVDLLFKDLMISRSSLLDNGCNYEVELISIFKEPLWKYIWDFWNIFFSIRPHIHEKMIDFINQQLRLVNHPTIYF